MANVEKLLVQSAGGIDFGNYSLPGKSKAEKQFGGDAYKVKTFKEITKLEKNGSFLYESVPGTAVNDFFMDENGVAFLVEGDGDAQITLGLAEEKSYEIFVDGERLDEVRTGLGGKLTFSVELAKDAPVKVEIKEG